MRKQRRTQEQMDTLRGAISLRFPRACGDRPIDPYRPIPQRIKGFLRAATAWWRSLPRESSSPTPRTAARRRPSPASCCGTEKAFDYARQPGEWEPSGIGLSGSQGR